MPILPADAHGAADATRCSRCSPTPASARRLLREWFPTIVDYASLGPDWPGMLTLAHVAAPEYDWAHGLTLAAAAERAGTDPDRRSRSTCCSPRDSR